MGHLGSTLSVVGRKQVLTLAWSATAGGRVVCIVRITEYRRLVGATYAFPAVFEFHPAPPPPANVGGMRHFDRIVVVAAPGAQVDLLGFPEATVDGWDVRSPNRRYPAVDVYRVQDAALLPPQCAPIDESVLVHERQVFPEPDNNALSQLYQVSSGPGATLPEQMSARHLPNGVRFLHPHTRSELHVRVPAFGEAGARARFWWHYDPGGSNSDPRRPYLKVVATAPAFVHIEVVTDLLPSLVPGGGGVPAGVPWRVYHAAKMEDVPALGEVPAGTGRWTHAASLPWRDERLQIALEVARATVDVAVGFVPVLGDLADIGEFVGSLFTGADRWGRPTTVADQAMMGVGTLLPFVGGGTLRAIDSLRSVFGRRADLAAEVIGELEVLKQRSPADFQELERAAEAMRTGRALSPSARALVERLGGQLSEPRRAFFDLLNADGTGFADPRLQLHFRRSGIADPEVWARSTRGRARQLLAARVGDVRAAVGKAPRQLRELRHLPRSSKLTEPRLAEARRRLAAHGGIWPLPAWIRQVLGDGPLPLDVIAHVKGLVGEALSLPKQLELLRALGNPDARLLTGLKFRFARGGAPVQFTDNIAAVMTDTELRPLGVMEVKTRARGATYARSQIFEWIEGRLTFEAGETFEETSQEAGRVVLVANSRVYKPDGTFTLAVETEYHYHPRPGAGPVRVVVGLTHAPRAIFAPIEAPGRSLLGTERSGDRVAASTRVHQLDYSLEEVDTLVADILLGRLTGP